MAQEKKAPSDGRIARPTTAQRDRQALRTLQERLKEFKVLSPLYQSKAVAIAAWRKGAGKREHAMKNRARTHAMRQLAGKGPIQATVSSSSSLFVAYVHLLDTEPRTETY